MTKDFADLILIAVLLTGLLILIRWHFKPDNEFSLMALVCTDGKLNDKKFMRTGAWLVSTWGFYWLTLHDKMTEWYFGGYMLAWTGVAAFDKWQREREGVKQ